MATALVESIALPENPPQEAFTLTAGQRQLLANDRNVRVEVAFYRDGRAVAPDSGKPMSPRNTACVFDNDKDVLLLGSEAALRALNNAVALFIIFAGQCEIGDHGVVTRMTNRFGGRAILQSDATRNAKLLATTHARASPSAY